MSVKDAVSNLWFLVQAKLHHVCGCACMYLSLLLFVHALAIAPLTIGSPGNRGVASHSDDVGSLEREIDGDGERWRKAETDRDRDEMAV